MEKRHFDIGGMTCSGCERAVERAVSRLDGVHSARADHQKGQLDVEFSPPCTPERIGNAVEKAGYEVTDKPRSKMDALYLLIILLGLSVIARQLGWTEIFRAVPTVSGQQLGYLTLFLTGLLTSVHCIAMCGGLNLAQSISGEHHSPIWGSLLYNLGRLTSYTLIGGLLGFIGEKAAITLRVRGLIGLCAGIGMLLMGIRMLTGFSLPRKFRISLPKGLVKRLNAFKKCGPYAVGLVNGFMPCGPLQSMQLYAIASGSFFVGASSMFFFCLGTIPLVLLFGAAAGILKQNWRQKILQLGSAMLVLIGLSTMQNNLALTGVTLPWAKSGGESTVISSTIDGGVQYVSTTLRANGYDDIRVTAGIPVIWTITVEEAALNGCNNEIFLPAFDQQVKLEVGTTTISFTPEKAGTYPYTCWMGMLQNTITVTEE
ncbi:MAG: sulfite exporter TauE/SafE family protein [Oscillospiraceae bacterium]|nr:sulfite exporter TauE/SafE family protein [Oscillospiraceae bacterium]MBQ8835714.1 sulfite exporter TauE/SafE family protein [Oscillospiraceae bacterium]